MDTVVIRQFNYVAPNQEEFIDTKYNVFTQGLVGSDPKYRQEEDLGMVILPMPQSFGEKRSVNFGEDTMNTLSAGMTQQVAQDMKSFLLGVHLEQPQDLHQNFYQVILEVIVVSDWVE